MPLCAEFPSNILPVEGIVRVRCVHAWSAVQHSAQGPNVSCDGVHRALQGKSIHQRSNNESLILFGIIFVTWKVNSYCNLVRPVHGS